MAAAIPRHRMLFLVVALSVLAAVLLAVPLAQAADTPRRGGVLLAVIGADPPSLDPHQESTFANIQLVAPLYSLLLQIDPYEYPKVVGDLATEWKISPDGLTYTFKIRQGVKFHDNSPLTAADVKATYDKIIFPPAGTRSIRKVHYTAVERIEAPDAGTVVFKLKFPSASLLGNLASPWNVIFPKKYLDKDPNYFMKNVVGSGPFKFKSYTRGSTFEGERNPDYFIKDRPYLDATSSSSARKRRCSRRPSDPGAPISSSATCPTPKWRPSRSNWVTRSSSRRRHRSASSASPCRTRSSRSTTSASARRSRSPSTATPAARCCTPSPG
jgi:peptide/nickel transport system substrate-binding protein